MYGRALKKALTKNFASAYAESLTKSTMILTVLFLLKGVETSALACTPSVEKCTREQKHTLLCTGFLTIAQGLHGATQISNTNNNVSEDWKSMERVYEVVSVVLDMLGKGIKETSLHPPLFHPKCIHM